jgi:hypothetical protein
MKALRSVAAIVIGYAVMIAGAWLGQESVFPGTEYGKSPILELLTVGVLTATLAGTGGAVTAVLAPSRPFLHLLPMAVLISIETISLYVTGRVRGPLWFELLAGTSLIAGTVIGAWVGLQVKRRLTGAGRQTAAV